MRFLIAFTFLFLGACSSTKKNTAETKPAAAAVKADTAKKDMKKAAAAAVSEGAVTCKLDASTRTLEVVSTDAGGAVKYTKDGESTDIATCNKGSSYCQSVVDKIKGNLEGAGFSCQ